ncbi:hypothetical protein Hanom_Chr07g00643611 [Helianthus anomalus]
MSVVCGPHLQASAREDVDQMSAVCKKKRVCFFFLQKQLHTNTQHTQQRSALSLQTLSLSTTTTTTTAPPPPPPPHHLCHHHRTTSAITGLLSLSTNSLSLYNHMPAISLYKLSLSLREVVVEVVVAEEHLICLLGFVLIDGFGCGGFWRWWWWRWWLRCGGRGGGRGRSVHFLKICRFEK